MVQREEGQTENSGSSDVPDRSTGRTAVDYRDDPEYFNRSAVQYGRAGTDYD